MPGLITLIKRISLQNCGHINSTHINPISIHHPLPATQTVTWTIIRTIFLPPTPTHITPNLHSDSISNSNSNTDPNHTSTYNQHSNLQTDINATSLGTTIPSTQSLQWTPPTTLSLSALPSNPRSINNQPTWLSSILRNRKNPPLNIDRQGKHGELFMYSESFLNSTPLQSLCPMPSVCW